MDEAQIELLIQLQDVDLRIDENLKEEETLSSCLKQIEEKLKEMETDLLDKKRELKDTRKKRMEKELELEEIDEKLQRHEEEKYKVKSKQEFEAVEKEINGLEEKKDEEEEVLLELMEKEEGLSNLLPSLEKKLSMDKQRLAEQKKDLSNKLSNLEKNKGNLVKKREKLFPHINRVYSHQYEQLRKKRDGLAVVKVENGVCGGCSVRIPPSLVGKMRRSNIVYCENCSRIIHLGTRGGN